MAQESTLHVKVDPKVAEALRELARMRRQTMGELVRQAIIACYQADLWALPQQQGEALAAFKGGYISIGKLAEVMGMLVVQLRIWLKERGISQNNSFGEADAANA